MELVLNVTGGGDEAERGISLAGCWPLQISFSLVGDRKVWTSVLQLQTRIEYFNWFVALDTVVSALAPSAGCVQSHPSINSK